MDTQDILPILKRKFNNQEWKNLIEYLFPNVQFKLEPESIPHKNQLSIDTAESILNIGSIDLQDLTKIVIFEVKLKPGKNIGNNRVAIRNLVMNEISSGYVDGAFVAFHDESQPDWRLSFISKKATISENSQIRDIPNNAKRYTYLLGPNHTCRTPFERFKLLKQVSSKKLDDILEAFSVEKVSKEFFKEYKEHYQNFVQFLTGKRLIRENGKWKEKEIAPPSPFLASVFSGDEKKREKEARDFCKKLLGRIVFLYFVQKKRWLGASSLEYDDGAEKFIQQLYDTSNRENFYNIWLRSLFFHGLNAHRANDEFTMPNGSIVKVPFLNGGLFEEDETDRNAGLLTIPSTLFSNDEKETPLKRGFLDFLNAYNFTIYEDGPDEHIVAVDPEMLGHIFENLLEDNKDKGAYYTPKPVVHYMCQESIIEYLLLKILPENIDNDSRSDFRNKLEKFIKYQEASEIIDYDITILKLLRDVKICDPAIGSGAFPMGLLTEMYHAIEVLYFASPDATAEIWHLGEEWNAARVKLDIIQNSIYGVDIEKGAVDIARLRFWLSLIVEENYPKPLPNLDYKIVVGNSLISTFENEVLEIDWNARGNNEHEQKIRELAGQIALRQKDYFESTDDKHNIYLEIRGLKIDLIETQLRLNEERYIENSLSTASLFSPTKRDKERAAQIQEQLQLFSSALRRLAYLRNHPNESLTFFDWELDFPEVMNGHFLSLLGDNERRYRGFDIVIANPPYMRVQSIEAILTKYKPVLEKKYKTARGAYDLANLFFELAVTLSADICSNSYIFPHKFLNSDNASTFREFLMHGRYIDKLAHFGANMVFNDADTYTCIAFFSNRPNEGFLVQKFPYKSDFFNLLQDNELYNFIPYDVILNISRSYGNNIWVIFNNLVQYQILEKIFENTGRLSDLFEDIFQGIATSKDDLYICQLIKEEDGYYYGKFPINNNIYKLEKTFFKPILKGRDVHRYEELKTENYVFFPYIIVGQTATAVSLEDLRINYPFTFQYVMANETEFKKRESGKAGKMQNWYAYIYPKNLVKFDQPKLSSMEICSDHPNVTLNYNSLYHSTTVYSWTKTQNATESFEYLLAIANSKLLWWFMMHTGDTLQGDARRFMTKYLNPFPIPREISVETDLLLQNKVQTVMVNKANGINTTDLELEINALVYKLYKLTFEEVNVIDPDFQLTKIEYQNINI